MKILVCEDDEVVIKVIQVTLSQISLDAVYVTDGLKALDYLSQHDVDLVITDIHMPYHNGDEILNYVKTHKGKHVPVIMISSDDEEEVVSLALKSGVSTFISKPVNAAKLIKAVQEAQNAVN